MLGKMTGLLRNRDFILFLGLVTGLLFDDGAQWTKVLVLPALGWVMTLSVMGISGSTFREPGSLLLQAILGAFMSYGVLSMVLLAMAAVLVQDGALWSGFVILAAVPPAVAVIPFADFLKGDRRYALIGTTGAYLAGLLLMPAMAYFFLETEIADPFSILIIILELVIVPFVMSRIFIKLHLDGPIAPYKGTMTNWSFFLVVYTVVGLNQEHFVRDPIGLMPVVLIALCTTFLLGFLLERICVFLKTDPAATTTIVLLGTLKNYGLAAGIALALFERETALPATVSTIFMIVYVIWLNFRTRKGRSFERP
jgi:BASS family bile acid:Na+ symporter